MGGSYGPYLQVSNQGVVVRNKQCHYSLINVLLNITNTLLFFVKKC